MTEEGGHDAPRPAPAWHVPGYTAVEGLAVDRAGALVLATQDATGARVVLRVLTPALTADGEYMRRLREDVARLRELREEHLVGVLDLIERPKAVVYEAVTGPSLDRVIDRRGPLPPAAAYLLLDSCLAALAALHGAGLTHGDVRPGTLVVIDDGDVRVRDAAVPAPALHAGLSKGTPEYMAPELWSGAPASAASDIYAATAVFVEALTGSPPFPNLGLNSLRRAHDLAEPPGALLPAAARDLVAAGMAKDPADRPGDAAAFRAEITTAAGSMLDEQWRDSGRAWLASAAQSVEAMPVAPPPPMPPPLPAETVAAAPAVAATPAEPWWKRRRIQAGLGIGAAVLAVLIVVLISTLGGSQPASAPTSSPLAAASGSPGALFDTSPVASLTPTASPTPTVSPTPHATGTATASAASPPSFMPVTPSPTPTPSPTVCASPLVTLCPSPSA